jgi:hypothetical protein
MIVMKHAYQTCHLFDFLRVYWHNRQGFLKERGSGFSVAFDPRPKKKDQVLLSPGSPEFLGGFRSAGS